MYRTQNLQQFRPRDNEPDDRQKSPYDFPRIIKECDDENKLIGEELDRRLKLQHLQREKEAVKARYDYITEPRKKLSDTVDENVLKEQSMKFTMNRSLPKYNTNNEQVYNFDNERKENNNFNNNLNSQNNNYYNNRINPNYNNQGERNNYQNNNFNNTERYEQNKNFENNFFYKSNNRYQPLYKQTLKNLDLPPSPNKNVNNNLNGLNNLPFDDYNYNNQQNLSRSQSFPIRNQKFDNYYYDNNYDRTFDNKNQRFIQTPYKIEYHQRQNHFNNPSSNVPDYMLYDDKNISKTRPYYFYDKQNIQYRKYSPYIYDYERSRFGDKTYNYYLNEAMRSDISKDWKYPPQYYYLPRFNTKTHTYENNY